MLVRIGTADAEGDALVVRSVLHGAMALYLTRYLNVPPARIPGEEGEQLGDLPPIDGDSTLPCSTLSTGSDRSISPESSWRAISARPLAWGADRHAPHAVLREDKASMPLRCWRRQPGNLRFGATPTRAAHILIAAARYLAAHSPTERAALQTADIARRLMRGGELYRRGQGVVTGRRTRTLVALMVRSVPVARAVPGKPKAPTVVGNWMVEVAVAWKRKAPTRRSRICDLVSGAAKRCLYFPTESKKADRCAAFHGSLCLADAAIARNRRSRTSSAPLAKRCRANRRSRWRSLASLPCSGWREAFGKTNRERPSSAPGFPQEQDSEPRERAEGSRPGEGRPAADPPKQVIPEDQKQLPPPGRQRGEASPAPHETQRGRISSRSVRTPSSRWSCGSSEIVLHSWQAKARPSVRGGLPASICRPMARRNSLCHSRCGRIGDRKPQAARA